MKFKNILDPEGQIFSLNKMDKVFKNKLLNNSFCRMIAETSGPCIVVFTTRDSVFLYSVIKWTVNETRVWVKMLSLLQILS